MNKEQFSVVYREYLPQVYNYAYYLCRSKETAEDATAEAFMKTWEYLQTQKIEYLKAWLFKLVKNYLINRTAREGRFMTLDFEPLVSESNIDTNLAYEQMLKVIDNKLKPETYKEVLLLRYKFELEYYEIAEVLNKGEDNIRKIHERALTKLKTLV